MKVPVVPSAGGSKTLDRLMKAAVVKSVGRCMGGKRRKRRYKYGKEQGISRKRSGCKICDKRVMG